MRARPQYVKQRGHTSKAVNLAFACYQPGQAEAKQHNGNDLWAKILSRAVAPSFHDSVAFSVSARTE